LGEFKQTDMSAKRISTVLLFAMIVAGVSAQDRDLKAAIVDVNEKKTIVTRVSSSSSSSCESSDFPVYQGSTKTDVNFADLKNVIVRPDVPAADPNNYLTVELIFKNGKSALYEMVKHIRIIGTTESGEKFSIKIMDVNMVDVLHKLY